MKKNRSIATEKSINKHLSQNQQKSRQIRSFAGIFSVNKTKKKKKKNVCYSVDSVSSVPVALRSSVVNVC